MRVTSHPDAEIELYDAALYYESQRARLGSTFLQAIETAMDEIHENPMARRWCRAKQTGAAVPLFSHVLCRDWDLRILAIVNQRRRPLYWLRRQ